MAMLNTSAANWNLQTAQKVIRKARWGEHMRSMRETMVSQERWNTITSWSSFAVMGATFVSPKIADGIFGTDKRGPAWIAQKLWDVSGQFPQEAIRREEWRGTFLSTAKGAPQMLQGLAQTSQQTGQMEMGIRNSQTQAEQDAMRSASESASGIKQDDRALRELIDRTFIQGDPTNTIIRAFNGG